ncbi:PMT5 Dolichyl-phosphate-mannose--protein mannosyltransferase 5 [Candida maltosa Xu316]|uniref:Dolichyl-phosphate-mannose--protein mannosyltransferase n=1 Tax=Candida maltosa (strain Xu316) TaxID=1245528 RepID=M3JAV9_CANMX|nr:hypothetical protein G210_0030 [Candida maltosa Xu316]
MSKELPQGYARGPYRFYYTSKPSKLLLNLTNFENFLTFVILTLAIVIRLYKLYIPDRIVFDEIHIVKYIKHYYTGETFVDVHPPLGRLIYYYLTRLFVPIDSSVLQEFDADKIGQLYPEDFPYLWLRLFSGLCGIGHVLVTFFTSRLTCTPIISAIVSSLVCLENSSITDSRLILLDGPLLFAQSLVILNYKSFTQCQQFTKSWWFHLFATGVSLGLNISIKISGAFNYLWVGILTTVQLWEILGDLEISVTQWIKHIVSRVVALIIVPLTIYCSVFYIHFELLPKEGPGSGFLSPHFRSTLVDYESSPVEVLYGSTVTIKHNELEKYLHSHDKSYPRGSNLQQVTLYEFPDENNEWIIETKHKYYEHKLMDSKTPIKDGDIIRLYHKSTGHYLHANDIRPPISEHEYSYEINCNETRGLLGNVDYEFKVRTISKKSHSENDLPLIKLRTTETVFQLLSRGSSCSLMSHEQKLPEWGAFQNEVLCVQEPTIPNTLWYIESNSHPLLDGQENVEKKFPKFTFWNKLFEIHQVMFRLNKSFTNNHPYASNPMLWLFLTKGISFFNNYSSKLIDEDSSVIYYLGNIAIYYSVNLVVLISWVKYLFFAFINLNPYKQPSESSPAKSTFYENAWQFLLGWSLNYLPYFLVSRNLYLHHYLPALSFGILLLGQYLNYRVAKNSFIGYSLVILVLVGSVYCYYELIPIIYGLPWTAAKCTAHKWISNWDIDCLSYTG